MLLDRLPRQLSQGQRQRVSLGRALVRDPRLYLFDEPISHLDAKLRNAMRRELKRIRASLSQTTIYVTHDYLEALSLADRVVVLFQGEVLQFDQKEKVYNLPAAMEVGQLFGDPPMMFFDGKLAEKDNFMSDDKAFSIQQAVSQVRCQLAHELSLDCARRMCYWPKRARDRLKAKCTAFKINLIIS